MVNKEAFIIKMQELLKYSIVHGMPSKYCTDRFSDGVIMGFWWKKHKKEIYALQNESLIAEKIVNVDKLWHSKNCGLSFEEKMQEFLTYLRMFGKPQKKSLAKFSDYTSMSHWWNNNYASVYELKKENVLASEICYILKNGNVDGKNLSFKEKMDLLLIYLQYNLKLPGYKNFATFSDGEVIRDFWNNHKRFIYDLRDSDDVAKDIIDIVLKDYKKNKDKVFEERLFEILEYIKKFGIPARNGNDIFKDGTKLGRFWYDNRRKIYELKDILEIAFEIVDLVERIKPNYFDKLKFSLAKRRNFELILFDGENLSKSKEKKLEMK